MKQLTKTLLLFSLCVGLLSCIDKKEKETYAAIEVNLNNATPTVDIDKYTLIQTKDEDRRKDAEQILDLKRKWPLVMQSPSRAGFDTILSQNFTFTGEGKLLNREDYIEDRTKISDWKITYVKYDNLILQFYGEVAVLTYRNAVTNENVTTNEIEIEYISWADIYVVENRNWKIGSTQVVDFRIEKGSQNR
ncbi:MAG: nuclear transport factor 2 family protein [Cyclobacteriaceae bacterium]|nr:nuclear transport factor 2 family protein [Cyclobacteriaceae bacterium]